MIRSSRQRPTRRRRSIDDDHRDVSDEDFQDILAQTRQFVRTAVVPREQEILDDDRVPDDIRDQAKKMGLFGYAIHRSGAGSGSNLAQDVELAMEFGYTSLALRSMFGTNNGIAGQVLVGFGTDEQKARWLEGIASGDVIASFALTEPGAGSNPSGLRTKAIRDGRRLADHRPEAVHHQCADRRPVRGVRAYPARRRRRAGIAVFLVPADAPGVEVAPRTRRWVRREHGPPTSPSTRSACRGALIGGAEDIGYRAAMTSLARGRVHIAALAVGAAQRALDESVV